MKNWSNYIDRELTEVMEELSTLGYQVLNDDPGYLFLSERQTSKGQ